MHTVEKSSPGSLSVGSLLVPCLIALAVWTQACATRSCPPESLKNAVSRPVPPGPIRRVVVVSMDGLMPDSYMNPERHALRIPTLRWMVEHGATSEGVTSVFPSVTYPSHTTMVTGVNPGKHGIVSNRAFDPLENDMESWRWYAEETRVEPIWRTAQRLGYDSALIHWPVTVGADVRWLLPEYWRAKNTQDQKLMRAVATPGLLEQVAAKYPGFWSRYVPPNVSDDALTDVALHVLEVGKPRLMFLHLVEVDGAQHRHGIDSEEARAAIENDDRQLARILKELERLELARETAVVVVSDHGFTVTTKMVRPCVLLTEAGLVETAEAGRIRDWKATVLTNSGQAYVYIKDPADNVTRESVRGIFASRLGDPKSGIGRIYTSDEIRERGGDPTAFMALEPSDTYQFGPGCVGAYEAAPQYRATHGFDPSRPEMRASLLMVGPGIPRGRIDGARLIDLAPTIAAWFGLPQGAVDGAPLKIAPRK